MHGQAPVVLLVIGGAALVALVIYVAWLVEKKRREAMAALASHLGYDFSPRDRWGLPGRYDAIGLFSRGHSRRARNVIHGEREGAGVKIFDYRYTTGSGKNQTTHSRTALVLEMPGERLPGFRLRREGLFDKVAAFVGFDDIDFESNEFSKRYFVKCRDKRFAYDVVNPRQMEYLLGIDDICVEFEGFALAFYRETKLSPEGLEWLHRAAWEFVGNVPEFALERGSRSAGR